MLTFNYLSFCHFVYKNINNRFIDFLYKMTEWEIIEGKHLIKSILWENVPF